MSLFQRNWYGEDPSFTNLFRMLDDWDTYSREAQGLNPQARHRHGHRALKAISPRFDVRETETTYELHGELPGIDRKDLSIEFSDPQTIVISGKVERNYTAGTPPAGFVEGGARPAGHITEAGESSHKTTVSDEADEAAKEQGEPADSHVVKKGEQSPERPAERYWYQERSFGSFQRSFPFASRIDEAGVKATLNNGILHLTVPKATKKEGRRINID